MYCIITGMIFQIVANFGIFGACRRVELYNLCINDVKEEGSVLIVNKKWHARIFTIVSMKNLIMLRSVKNAFP